MRPVWGGGGGAAIIGQDETVVYTLAGTSYGGRFTCDHIDLVEARFVPDRALLASYEQREGAIPGRSVYLSGKRSLFGLNVETIQYTRP